VAGPSKAVEWAERIWRLLLYAAMLALVLVVLGGVVVLLLGLIGIDFMG
jgi:hypothetical protein